MTRALLSTEDGRNQVQVALQYLSTTHPACVDHFCYVPVNRDQLGSASVALNVATRLAINME
eukprot:5979464-Prymnesium_polylepis.1